MPVNWCEELGTVLANDEVINGKTVSVYDTAVSSEMIWKTIVVSLIFTAIYMTITYINFKKKDRD